MRTIFTIFISTLVIIVCSCSKEGEIQSQSTRNIKINGKEYRFLKVVLADGERAVWLLIPTDSRIEPPQSISWNVSCGKNCTTNLSAIFVKS